MGLLDRFKKNEPKTPDFYVDQRLIEKIEKSDLWEYRAKCNELSGNKSDLYFGNKKSDELFPRFIEELGSVNSGMVSRKAFVDYGFSESEINAIFGGNFDTRIGISNPHRCVKDKVWSFMCFRETARLYWLNGHNQLAKQIGMTAENT